MSADPRYRLILKNGTSEWRNKAGRLDSWNDLPAVIWSDAPQMSSPGTKFWYRDGAMHRDNDLPARIETSGYSEWWFNGEPARPSGGPNIVDHDGTQEWTDTQLRRHRDNDLPAYIRPNGQQVWYQHGEMHRDHNKPAMVGHDGMALRYFKHGKLHRTDGPALIDRDGTTAWYIDGRELDAKEIAELQAKLAPRARKNGPKP